MKSKNMFRNNLFKAAALLTFLTALFIGGCSKNDSLTGPNQGFRVSFTISQLQGPTGGTEFLFKPSADAKISRIVNSLAAQQFADTINYGNPNYVYSKDTSYIIREYINVTAGQQWKFDFTGSGPTGNNSNYNVSSNYTAQ